MSTKIDKKDTLDISDGIAKHIYTALQNAHIGNINSPHVWIREIIQEGLNDWISDCETEDAMNGDYQP